LLFIVARGPEGPPQKAQQSSALMRALLSVID
jgi:hypothetical protein